jgi:hypothetical protein
MASKLGASFLVLVIVVVAYFAWSKNKLNLLLPAKLRHEDFIGLNRSGIYVMAPGGRPGIPGMDLNTSDWV